MSKTETQSDALTAERRLFITAVANLELRKKFGDEGFRLDLERDELEALIEMAERASRLDAENKALRSLAATCYAGLGAECNLPENWLDALNAAANGEAFDNEGLLPFTAPEARDEVIRQLEAQVKELRERLEIDPSHPIDGIAARDETIRQLDAQVKTLRPDAERWKAIRLGVPSGDRILRVYTMKQGCGTWLRGTDADFAIDAARAAAKTGEAAGAPA